MTFVWHRLAWLAPALMAAGCATTVTTEPLPIPICEQPMPITIALGNLADNRLKEAGQALGQKQVRIGVAKVKNSIADILTRSSRFRNIVNLPTDISTISTMLEAARTANCDFLVVGEVDQFDILSLGANRRLIASVGLEALTFPFGIIVFILSGYQHSIWANGLMYDRTAMGALSVSLHFIETENGKIVGHVSNALSTATKPVNALVYGDRTNPDDDWVDIGKELGMVAIHNLGVTLIERMATELERIHKK